MLEQMYNIKVVFKKKYCYFFLIKALFQQMLIKRSDLQQYKFFVFFLNKNKNQTSKHSFLALFLVLN